MTAITADGPTRSSALSWVALLVLVGVFGTTRAAAWTKAAPRASAAATITTGAFLNSLSEAERAWLREHPVIRVAHDPSWPPIEFTDERGTPSGMTADYLALIELRMGVTFERVPHLSWQEAHARMQRWEIDMTTSVAVTPERETFWAFTRPYMTIPIVVATRSDVPYIADLRELAGKKVAVVDGYVANVWIARDFPAINRVRVETTEAALAAVGRGEVFACVDNMLVMGHYMALQELTDLRITGSTPYSSAQCMAVRKDWPILADILDKALDSISPTERSAIYRRWLPLRYDREFSYLSLWPIAAILAAVLLGLVAWNWRLALEVRDRKEAEKALRRTESLLTSVTEGTSDAIYVKDLQGCYLMLNAAAAQVAGKTIPEVLGRDDTFLFPPDEARGVMEGDRRVLASGSVLTHEESVTSGGVTRTFLTTKGPMRDADRIVGLFGIARDITERKLAEVALRESEERFRTLVEQAPEAIFIQTHRRFAYVNAATLRLLGAADPGQLLGEFVESRVHPDFQAQVGERIRLLNEQRLASAPADRVFVGLDGSQRDVSVSAVPFLFKGDQGALVFVRDITERKRAEEALRLSESEFRSLAEAMPQIVWATRPDGWNIYFNRQWTAYTGLTLQEGYGHGWSTPLHPEDQQRAQDAWQRAMEHRDTYSLECRLRRADGVYRWWLIRGVPYCDEHGEILKWFGTCTDIDDMRRAADDIKQLNESLERRVAERTAELRAANEELSAFAYAVSHDLRAPLRAMNGFSRALLEDHGAILRGKAREHLDEIILASLRMGGLIDGLLRLSRTTMGELCPDAVDLSALAARTLEELAAAEPERHVTWTVESGLTARGDARMLDVVLANLLGNAWKYTTKTPHATIEFGAVTTAVPRCDASREDGDQGLRTPNLAVFFVRDNGAGFDVSHAARLFQPFQRLHREDEFPGLGIGLATVQRIVHRHGGTIRGTAAPGAGATFVFSLPSAFSRTDEQRP